MSLYILDPMIVTFSAEIKKLRTTWYSMIQGDGEVFEHRYITDYDGFYPDTSQPYFWDRYETLQKKERKMFFRLIRCIEKNQAKGAACAARHLFRIARARERRESQAKRGEL